MADFERSDTELSERVNALESIVQRIRSENSAVGAMLAVEVVSERGKPATYALWEGMALLFLAIAVSVGVGVWPALDARALIEGLGGNIQAAAVSAAVLFLIAIGSLGAIWKARHAEAQGEVLRARGEIISADLRQTLHDRNISLDERI